MGLIKSLKEVNESFKLRDAIKKDDIEKVKAILNGCDKHKIVLDINDASDEGKSVLLNALNHNNTEMVKLLLDYANRHNIILNLNERNSSECLQSILL